MSALAALAARAAGLVLLALVVLDAAPARASGRVLDGRMAPEMVFQAGVHGVVPGTTLSSYRGRVVWVKFVLRDCPRCRKALPQAQDLHERWGGSGLVVLVVMHGLQPREIQPFLARDGYTFRVGCDLDGRMAQAYGVRHRPTDYVIGVDGRVRASNGAPDEVLRTELGRYRLGRLGPVPEALLGVRDAVWRWNYGAALKQASAAAAAEGAAPDVVALAERVRANARSELDARVALATLYARRGKRVEAVAILDRVAAHFEGTSLASVATEARRSFDTRSR